ncbi:MAG: phosphatase PAP2 family protein [Bacillota bacterium]|nr:phosphatase PAP2 family protein [Bacillota bacterium]
MKRIKSSVLPLCLLFLIPLMNIVYAHLNNSTRGLHSLVTDLDKSVPFIKSFAIPYVIWLPFLVITLIYLCFKNREVYYRVIISLILGLIACFTIYFFFQTTVVRPQLQGKDFLTNLVRFVYATDSPFNCFPSIHVLTSYILIKGTIKCSKKISLKSIIIIVIASLIILSTQFIKQHVIMDLIFAILLGNTTYKLVEYLSIERSSSHVIKHYSTIPVTKKIGT